MISCMEQEIDLITGYFLDYQKFQIQLCTYRHPIFQDYLIEPTAERHFKHLWNIIVKIVLGNDSFKENLYTLLDFTVFTPKYTKKSIKYIMLPERIQKICEICIASKDFSEILFNIFVQILISQKPRRSLEMIESVLNEYKSSNLCLDSLRDLFVFYSKLQNIENDEQARQLINAVDSYISFREKSISTSRLSGYQFSRLLVLIFDKLTSFPLALANILKYDLFIFSFLECEECSSINISQIPPFSLILKSKNEVPKSFYMRYKEIFITMIKMLIMFSKLCFTADENNYLAFLTGKALSFVESSSVGRDAFIFVLLYFMRSDFLRKNAEIFLQYIREGEAKSGNDDNSSTYSKVCRYNAMAIFIFSFDRDIFPSTISLICDEYSHILITSTLKRIIDHFPDSPFRKKTESVFEKIIGHPHLKKSIFERATQVTYQIWKNGFKDSNKSEAVDLLINLSQKRSNILFSEGSAININSSNVNYFLQLSLALFTKNTYTQKQFCFYCYVASILFPLANSSLPPKSNYHFIIDSSNDEKSPKTLPSEPKLPSQYYFYSNDNDSESDDIIYFSLPRWHFLSIYKELILTKMTENINFIHFLTRFSEGLPPSHFIGGFLLFSHMIQNGNADCKYNFSQFCSQNTVFLSLLFSKITLYELPEVTREMMRFMEGCPDLSFECIKILTDTLITTAKTHRYRTFIRFLAPLFRNHYYVKQVIIREYYKVIVATFLEFVKEDEKAASLSFIYFWRTLGTFSNVPKSIEIRTDLLNLVCLSLEKIELVRKNENELFNALFELVVKFGIGFLVDVIKNVKKCSDQFLRLIVNLPKETFNAVDGEMMEFLRLNLSPDIDGVIEKLKSDDNANEVTVSWVPWPINHFIYEVTGMVCSNCLNS